MGIRVVLPTVLLSLGCILVIPLDDAWGQVVLYEGNNCSQDVLCEEWFEGFRNFKKETSCPNDEARSLFIRNARRGEQYWLFDSPDGSLNDDWVEIAILNDFNELCIKTFERSFDDGSIRIIYHKRNGLDGKVSAMTIKGAIGPN